MGFTATEVAQGTIASGSTGDNVIYTVPGSTKAHVIHMTIRFADAADSASVKAGPSGSERLVFKASPQNNGDIADCAAGRSEAEDAAATMETWGTIGNKIIETGGRIIIDKQGANGALEFSVSAYEIT